MQKVDLPKRLNFFNNSLSILVFNNRVQYKYNSNFASRARLYFSYFTARLSNVTNFRVVFRAVVTDFFAVQAIYM